MIELVFIACVAGIAFPRHFRVVLWLCMLVPLLLLVGASHTLCWVGSAIGAAMDWINPDQ